MRTQAARFGAELVARDVSEVDLTAEPKIVKVGDEVHRAHAVIVATGSKYRYLGLDNEARLLGRGVSADRKSTRLNSSHANTSYAVFCLKKKKARQPAPARL